MDDDKRRIYPKNPLGVIALFVFFIEAIATVSLKFILENNSAFAAHIIWFIILYPSIVGLLFFVMLWFRRENLYGPGDFRDDQSFVKLVRQIERLEVRQEAAQLDVASDIDEFIDMVRKLLAKNDVQTAVQLGRSLLKQDRYQFSLKVFEFLRDSIPSSHDLYTRILANLAYSQVGVERYNDAISNLLEVRKRRGDEKFYAWQAMPLAYCYHKIGDESAYKTWLEFATHRKEYAANSRYILKLYPGIEQDVLG